MKARRVIAGWVWWLRWRFCWAEDVADRFLRRDVAERNPWGLS